MYTALVSLVLGLLVGSIWTLLDLWKGWAMGIVLGTTVFVIGFALISRIIGKRIEPRFLGAQKQIQSGATQAALRTLEDIMPMTRWQIMLKGQLHAQIGCLYFSLGKDEQAMEHLLKSSRRVSDAKLFLAALHYRRGGKGKAKQVLNDAIGFNKKQMILYNVLAWMQVKDGDSGGAIETLINAQKKDEKGEATRDNLMRIRNGKKLNMKRFGMSWYALKLERPPASMRQAPPGMPRPGFRQKRRGGKR